MNTNYDHQAIHVLEDYVRFTFKWTAKDTLYFDTKVLVASINRWHQKPVIQLTDAYLALSNYYSRPDELQAYQSALISQDLSHFLWIERYGYPFIFRFEEAFRLTDMDDYGLSDLSTLLTTLNIPY